MRYTSNDAPRGITSIAARRAHACMCVYVRLMRGQDAWPAGQRRVTFTRSRSLLLARGRSARCSSSLARSSFGSGSPQRWRGRTVVGVAPSAARLPPLPPRLAPRSNLNYHFTLPFERAAAAATAETQAADSPVYLSSAPFSTLFFSFSSCRAENARSSRSMRSPTALARARDAKDARFNCDF